MDIKDSFLQHVFFSSKAGLCLDAVVLHNGTFFVRFKFLLFKYLPFGRKRKMISLKVGFMSLVHEGSV